MVDAGGCLPPVLKVWLGAEQSDHGRKSNQKSREIQPCQARNCYHTKNFLISMEYAIPTLATIPCHFLFTSNSRDHGYVTHLSILRREHTTGKTASSANPQKHPANLPPSRNRPRSPSRSGQPPQGAKERQRLPQTTSQALSLPRP